MNRLAALLLLALAVATPVLAGGPAILWQPGRPFVWPDGGAAIPYNPDQGPLGTIPADEMPAYTADAFGTPVVALFGPSDPKRTAPFGERHEILCRHLECAPCTAPRCPLQVSNAHWTRMSSWLVQGIRQVPLGTICPT